MVELVTVGTFPRLESRLSGNSGVDVVKQNIEEKLNPVSNGTEEGTRTVDVYPDNEIKAVLISWEDSQQIATYPWMDPEDFEDGMVIQTVGWLIGDSDRNWFICMGVSSDTPNVLNSMSIPKSCVLSIKELDPKEENNSANSD